MDLALLIFVPVVTTAVIALGALAFRFFARGIKASIRDDIKAHLIPNKGSSLADRLDKVEKAVDKLTKTNEATGCLPGCPRLNGFPHIDPHAQWQWMPEPYGSPPTWAANTQQPSPQGTRTLRFVPPTSYGIREPAM